MAIKMIVKSLLEGSMFVCMLSFFFFFFNSDGEYVLFLIAIKLPGRSLEIAWGCNPLCESVIVVIIIIIS